MGGEHAGRSEPDRAESTVERAENRLAERSGLRAPIFLERLQAAGNRAIASYVVQRLASHHPVIRQGSRGAAVRDAQTKLNSAMPNATPLVVDGDFGPLTRTAVVTFQQQHDLADDGVIGPNTWAVLDNPPAPVHPLPSPAQIAALGLSHDDIAQAQQKLNVANNETPQLSINAVYDDLMSTAVEAFQTSHGLPVDGLLGRATLTALDTAVPQGGIDREGNEEAVEAPGGAHPLGHTLPGTGTHPLVGPGGLLTGDAVLEAQKKLNIWTATLANPAPALDEDSRWGPATAAMTASFQTAHHLATGAIGPRTWAALDQAAPNATSGYEERQWGETVGGHHYEMSDANNATSKYSWSLDPVPGGTGSVMNVTCRVNYVGAAPNPAWPNFVTAVWNRFAAKNDATHESINIDFHLVSAGAGPESHVINVHTNNDRANAGDWYLGDTHQAETIPHEFGHLIGLSDEYQLHAGDYREVTGHEPTVGDADGPSGVTADQMAQNIQTQMMTRNPANVATVSTDLGLTMGAYAQQVLQAYARLPSVTLPAMPAVPPTGGHPGQPAQPAFTTTGRLVEDLDQGLPEDPGLKRYDLIQALTYSSGSIMGDPGRVTDHDHGGAQPRHVQEFVDHVGAIRGGTWRGATR